MDNASNLLSNLKILYTSYGGWRDLLRSSYFLWSLGLTALCWRLAVNGTWPPLAVSILPTLAGFSVAAYALFFAVLDERTRTALRKPSENFQNRSPLLILASSVSHAVIVQVLGVLMALIFTAKPIPDVGMPGFLIMIGNASVGVLGITLMIYGIILVVAAVLSIFRVLEVQAKVAVSPPS